LSKQRWSRFDGRRAAIVASVPKFMRTLPSPSRTSTRRPGRASAIPRPIEEARPIDPIM
jgi:hypothetical protein